MIDLRPAAAAMVSAALLLALVNAIEHADHQTASVAEKALVYQLVAVDDVFVTHDGAVKLLGFKSRLGGNSAAVRSGAPSCRVTADAAIDALLSDHSTTRLRAVLGTANTTRVRPCDRLWHVGQVLKNWQTEELGSDGRAELAAFIGTLLPAVLPERRIQLEAAFENAVRARHASPPPPTEVAEEEAPVSGLRAIRR